MANSHRASWSVEIKLPTGNQTYTWGMNINDPEIEKQGTLEVIGTLYDIMSANLEDIKENTPSACIVKYSFTIEPYEAADDGQPEA